MGMVLRLVAVALLSVMFACVKLMSERGVTVMESLFFRQFILLFVAVAWMAVDSRFGSGVGFEAIKTKKPRAHLIRMIVGLTAMGFNFGSYALLPMAEATTIAFAVPIFATALAALILHEPTGIHRWGAVLVGFIGVLIVVQPGSAHISLLGGIVAVVAALLTASVTIVIRNLGATEGSLTIVFWFALTSLIPLVPSMFWFAELHEPAVWGIALVMGIAGGLAQIALTSSLRLAPVALVMPMDYTGLIWASLFGWLLFSQWPTASTFAGAPIIIASGLYILWRETKLRIKT